MDSTQPASDPATPRRWSNGFRMPDPPEIGQRLRQVRQGRGTGRVEAARCIEISYQQLAKLEQGLNRVSAGQLAKLCRFLEVSADEILGLPRDVPLRLFSGEQGAVAEGQPVGGESVGELGQAADHGGGEAQLAQ